MKEPMDRDSFEARQIRIMRRQTALIAGILIIVLAVGIFLASQFASIKRCVDLIEQKVGVLDVQVLNDAVDSFTEAADQFSSIDVDEFNKTVESLQTAADNFGSVDIDKLNDTVSSLKDAADTFSDVDVEALNKLVQALESVSAKLEKAVSAITGIFGR